MSKEKFDIYEMVTSRIIDQLEAGKIPWNRPWTGVREGAFNRVTKRPYSLINQLLLRHTGEYASLKQWNERGGKVKKGEKSEVVVFWKMVKTTEKDAEGKDREKIIPMLRYYNVFHISQVEGVEPLPEEELILDFEPSEKAENTLYQYIEREGIALDIKKSNRAYYTPATDTIVLPLREQFDRESEFYSTAFHECIHSTGAKKRLDRLGGDKKVAAFGSDDYSREELVAEMGASTLLNMLHIETPESFKNNVAYIQSWLRALKEDKKMIVWASGRAEKAVKFLLNGKVEAEPELAEA